MKNVYNIVLIIILGYSVVQANALQEDKASVKLLKTSGCDKKISASLKCEFKKALGTSTKQCPKISKRCNDIFEGKVKK